MSLFNLPIKDINCTEQLKLQPNLFFIRLVYQKYSEAMKKLTLSIMELLGLSLDVGKDYYRDFFQDCGYIMRCNYYPRCPEPELTQGTGAHSDTVALTILQQEEVEGLEVFTGGAWQSILPVPGSLIINIRDTFMVLLLFFF